MSINDPYAPSSTRAPRWRALYQGQEVGGLEGFEVTIHSYFAAATFRATFAINADPAFGAEWWGAQEEYMLDLQASLDGGEQWTSLLIGAVDHTALDLVEGTVSVDGRDKSSLLIDAKTRETFLNHTASQIAEILAARHGMQADVQATSTLVDRYYGADHDRMSLDHFSRVTTEWDLLCNLAQHEPDYLVWVTGNTLHFKPGPTINDDPWEVVWEPGAPPSSNVDKLRLERSMYMAKDVVVAVRSWNSREAKGFTVYSPSSFRQSSLQSGKTQQTVLVYPNLTMDKAQQIANRTREDITRHERLITADGPGDLILTAQSVMKVSGTGTSWDQTYYVDYVTRRVGSDGFTMSVHAKNHSPNTQVAA